MKKHLTKWRVLTYLLILSSASLLIIGPTYAKYVSEIDGKGSGSVAAWGSDFTETNPIDLSQLKPGGKIDYMFNVTNVKDGRISEVSQEYSIILNTTGNLPLTYKLTANTPSSSGSYVNNGELNVENGICTLTGGILPHTTSTTHAYTLTISWPADKNDASYADEIDLVTLTVNAQQSLSN